jgi:hypothetical protein
MVKSQTLLSSFFLIQFLFVSLLSYSQLCQETYDNLINNYNYTFWNDNFKTLGVTDREFTIQTSDFGLKINYTDLSISNMEVTTNSLTSDQAFPLSDNSLFPNATSADIRYRILQNGSTLHEKAINPTNSGIKISQMAEYGTWCNRRFLDSLNYTNNANLYGSFSGIEFTSWHDRIKMTFYVKPRTTILNGQLELELEIPTIYNLLYNSGAIYGFANSQDQGFAIKGGTDSFSTVAGSGVIKTTLAQQDLLAGSLYKVSLILCPIKQNLSSSYLNVFDTGNEFNITSNQTLPNTTDVAVINFDENEGVYFIDIPRYTMGQYNCPSADLLQNIQFNIENTTNENKRIRICFRQIPAVNVTGFSSLLRSRNGDPLGVPIQISKNWHGSTASALHAGSWIKEYIELIIPANATEEFDYTRIGAKWGETYGAFSHQLSVVGAGVWRGGWLEAGLGSFGENITHSPDYEYGNSNGCDFRPFLVTNQNQGGTSLECQWTGNLGGLDFGHYTNESNQRIYQSEVKTKFKRYGPNLTETSISAISSDNKLKIDYTFFLNRSSDMTRVFYNVKLRALDFIPFNRFEMFQLGGDVYNTLVAQSVVYGNENGVTNTIIPTNSGSNDYTTSHQALDGNQPWLWIDGECNSSPVSSNLNINANAGLVIRSYKGLFNGVVDNTPYFRERSSSIGFSAPTGLNPTSYCLVPPQGVTSLYPGDSIELFLEVCLIPKSLNDYYGNDSLFAQSLSTFGNSWEPLFNEAVFNHPSASSPNSIVTQGYPIMIETINNEALVEIQGGKNYIPLVFTHVDSIFNPKLWRRVNNCWELIDQSNWGKDFWQTDFNPEQEKFEVIYNVHHEIGDSLTSNTYYFGNTPPPVESTDTIVSCDAIVWIDGIVYSSSNTSATYSLLGASGCDSLVRLNLTINTVDTSVSNNSPVLSSNETDVMYQWIDCTSGEIIEGETNQDFTAIINGSYAVIIDDGICIDTSSCYQVQNLGQQKILLYQNSILFPNPSDGLITIKFEQEKANRIIIKSMDGRPLHSMKNTSSEIQIDLSEYSNGVYLIELIFDSQSVIRHIVKE